MVVSKRFHIAMVSVRGEPCYLEGAVDESGIGFQIHRAGRDGWTRRRHEGDMRHIGDSFTPAVQNTDLQAAVDDVLDGEIVCRLFRPGPPEQATDDPPPPRWSPRRPPSA